MSVCPNLLEAGILGFTATQQLPGSVAVILVGSRDEDFQNPSVGIDEEMPLASFDLFVSIIADVVGTGLPPFSVVLTD